MLLKDIIGDSAPQGIIEMRSEAAKWLAIYHGNPSWLIFNVTTVAGVKRRKKLTMKPGKIVAREIARLTWAETPEVNAGPRLIDLIAKTDFWSNVRRSTEYMAATGGMAIKLSMVDGEPVIGYSHGTDIIPITWDNAGVTEAKFLTEVNKNGKVYLHVEERYIDRIENKLYLNEHGALKPVDLSEVYEDMAPRQMVPEGLTTFWYFVPPEANNFYLESPIGISCYANAVDTIQALDTAFDGLNSEIALGKKRIIVPAAAVRTVVDTDTGQQTRYFDPTEEIFQALQMEDVENSKIIDNTVELRIEEIKASIQALLDILSLQCGLSPGHLAFDSQGGIKTATEVIAENSQTYRTRQDYQNGIDKGLKILFSSLGQLLGEIQETDISWDDSVIEDRNSKANYWAMMVGAGLCEKWRAIKNIYKVSEKEARKRAEEIGIEQKPIQTGMDFLGG